VQGAAALVGKPSYRSIRAVIDHMAGANARITARASITTLLDDDDARAEMIELLSSAQDLATRINVVLEATGTSRRALQDLSGEVFLEAYDAILAEEPIPLSTFMALLAQAPTAAVAAAGPDLDVAVRRAMHDESPFGILTDTHRYAARRDLERVLTLIADSIYPPEYGTALMAAAASRGGADPEVVTATIVARLSDELADSASDIEWLGDVCGCLAGILHLFPTNLVDNLVEAIGQIRQGTMAARAIVGLAPALPLSTVERLVDGWLARFERAPSFIDVNQVLGTLAPVMTRRQVRIALATGAAPRDDGYEYSWLAVLRQCVGEPAKERVDLWATERGVQHLAATDDVDGTQRAFGQLVADLVSGRTFPSVLAMLGEHTRTLTVAAARAAAAGALASACTDDDAEACGRLAEDSLARSESAGERAYTAARLARFADGARQTRYVREALELESTLDNEHSRFRVLAELPATDAAAERIMIVLKTATKRDSACEKLAHLAPADDLADNAR
jgi:hypothetical protein